MHACVAVADVANHKNWSQDVQGVMWRHYELLCYIFHAHGAANAVTGPPADAAGSGGGKGGEVEEAQTISLLEFRAICRRAALTSPFLCLAQVDLLVPSHNG